MSKYGYISWYRGRGEWTPDLTAARDRYYPKRPTRITKLTSRKHAEVWWDAVVNYLMRKPSQEITR